MTLVMYNGNGVAIVRAIVVVVVEPMSTSCSCWSWLIFVCRSATLRGWVQLSGAHKHNCNLFSYNKIKGILEIYTQQGYDIYKYYCNPNFLNYQPLTPIDIGKLLNYIKSMWISLFFNLAYNQFFTIVVVVVVRN